jgi:hypothetical protein
MTVTINGTTGIVTPTSTGDVSVGNDLLFTGTGNRITGDFSNATIANRVGFQSSTTNGVTRVNASPNGTATESGYNFYNTAAMTSGEFGQIFATSSEVSFRSAVLSGGSFLPMTFYTGGSERVRIGTNGLTTFNTQESGAQLDAFAGRISSQYVRTDGASSTKYSVQASGVDVNGTSGNAWALSSAVGLGLFNLTAGCYHGALTTVGSTVDNTFRYFGTRGASILGLYDANASIIVGSLGISGGQVAGDAVTTVVSQSFDQFGLSGKGTSSGRLGGNTYSYHFERNGVGTATNFMAMGNGAGLIAGIRMPFAGRVIQGSLYGDAFNGTITVDVAVNGTPNASYRMSITSAGGDAGVNGDWQGGPLSFSAGDVIGMYQTTVPSTADGYTASLYVLFD